MSNAATRPEVTIDTLRRLGLNDRGIKAATFAVRSAYTGEGERCSSLEALNAALPKYRGALIEVWWAGDATPVRTF